MDIADIALMDQIEMARRESRERFMAFSDSSSGQPPFVGTRPHWWPEKFYCGCEHSENPCALYATRMAPEILFCWECFLDLSDEYQYDDPHVCELCAEKGSHGLLAVQNGVITVYAVMCRSCLEKDMP